MDVINLIISFFVEIHLLINHLLYQGWLNSETLAKSSYDIKIWF